jgi:hypothetical protein
MRSSRLGILVLITFTVLIGANCSYYNRIIARKNLVDGATAYKERKFAEAEQLFRDTVAVDPNTETVEGKTARVFLARTLHSQFIANRKDTAKAEAAINEYKKVLQVDPNDQSSFKAVASLLDNTDRKDESLQWVTERANNTQVKSEYRAEAYTSLAARKYSCANEISDVEPVKKTVKKDNKEVYQFTKPENPADFDRLKQCADEGLALVDQALAVEPASVQQMKNLDLKTMSIPQINENEELLKIFSSGWSYKANLLYQKMRIAEMEGNEAEKNNWKAKGDEARDVFKGLNDVEKNMEQEKTARKQAEEEEKANKNKK